MKTQIQAIIIILMATATTACRHEAPNIDQTALLQTTLKAVAPDGNLDYFKLPNEQELDKIPQDENNKLTTEKVALGKLLFHETGLAIAPKNEMAMETFSCASCHFASAGFQAGRVQGIGEGGSGFGVNGEGRIPQLAIYTPEELDVQPVRSPSAMNGAYQDVTLWNGQFGGAPGTNDGTEHA